MSLRKLAGPFNLTSDQGTPLVPHTIIPICYYPGFGLVMKIDNIPGDPIAGAYLALVAVDGIAQPINTQDIGTTFGFAPAVWRYDLMTSLLITNSGDAREKICLCRVPYVPRFFDNNFFHLSPIGMGVYALDRAIYANSTGVFGNAGGETSYPAGVSITDVNNVLPGRNNHEVYIGRVQGTGQTDNRGIFYDTDTRQFTTQGFHLGDGVIASFWDVDSGVLVTITDTPQYQFNIFSLDVIPTALSAVTLKSGVAAKGATAVFKVQVQGDKGDWSVGVLVDWSITSGDGMLLDTQTTTGPDGFATCRVFYPTDASVSTVLGASLVC